MINNNTVNKSRLDQNASIPLYSLYIFVCSAFRGLLDSLDQTYFLQLTLGENPSPALSSATSLWRRGEGLSPRFTADNRKNPYPSHKQRCHFIFYQIALMYYEDFLVFIAMKTTFLVNEAQTEYLTLLYNLVLVSTRRTQIIHQINL